MGLELGGGGGGGVRVKEGVGLVAWAHRLSRPSSSVALSAYIRVLFLVADGSSLYFWWTNSQACSSPARTPSEYTRPPRFGSEILRRNHTARYTPATQTSGHAYRLHSDTEGRPGTRLTIPSSLPTGSPSVQCTHSSP